jgi:quercetin dioxygenase-like cupin family protein
MRSLDHDTAKTASAGLSDGAFDARFTRRRLLGSTLAATAAGVLPAVAAAAPPPAAVGPADEIIRIGPLSVRFLVTGAVSGGTVEAFEMTVPARQRLMAPPHSHDHYEETVYGVGGVLTWTVDGRRIDVGPGQALCIPRGAVHRFDNEGDVDVRALSVLTPASIGPAFFREAAAILDAAAGGPPDVARMVAMMKRYGITPARP